MEYDEPAPQPQQYPPSQPQQFLPQEFGMSDIVRSISKSVRISKEEFEHTLAGEKKVMTLNSDGIPVFKWVKSGEPLVNEKGRQEIMAFLDPLMSESNTWSDLNEKEAMEKYREISETIAQMIAFNMEAWGLKLSNLHTLQIMIENFIDLSILKKVENRKMFDMLQRTVTETRHVVENTGGKESRGLFG